MDIDSADILSLKGHYSSIRKPVSLTAKFDEFVAHPNIERTRKGKLNRKTVNGELYELIGISFNIWYLGNFGCDNALQSSCVLNNTFKKEWWEFLQFETLKRDKRGTQKPNSHGTTTGWEIVSSFKWKTL